MNLCDKCKILNKDDQQTFLKIFFAPHHELTSISRHFRIISKAIENQN